jgi:hypothetical protein
MPVDGAVVLLSAKPVTQAALSPLLKDKIALSISNTMVPLAGTSKTIIGGVVPTVGVPSYSFRYTAAEPVLIALYPYRDPLPLFIEAGLLDKLVLRYLNLLTPVEIAASTGTLPPTSGGNRESNFS